ncbi:hypothetical protein NQZ68_023058 [Dissostichus eleginoides]|nr:hypothetical protein NQZ68_023058 [Dissostichus eleginoides]
MIHLQPKEMNLYFVSSRINKHDPHNDGSGAGMLVRSNLGFSLLLEDIQTRGQETWESNRQLKDIRLFLLSHSCP